MRAENFCYWLQGFFEIQDAGAAERSSEALKGRSLSEKQVEIIRKHLSLVFTDVLGTHEDRSQSKDAPDLTVGGGISDLLRAPRSDILLC